MLYGAADICQSGQWSVDGHSADANTDRLDVQWTTTVLPSCGVDQQ